MIDQLERSRSLSPVQVVESVARLTSESVSAELKAEFLSALARKGETTEEIAAFARELRELSVQPPLDAETRQREIIDVCGTGGDRLGTFNISTTVALVLASAEVTVAKHGNRAITSQAGSADVLEELGVPIDLTPEEAAESLRRHHFAFFFAQKYHPAFKQIGPARKLCAEKGQRTIFNFLGPLLNPARPTAQLIGVPRPELCEPMARVLQSLGIRRGMVVCGNIHPSKIGPDPSAEHSSGSPLYLDELSPLGDTALAEFYQDRGFHQSVLQPGDFPFQPARLADLAGADRQTNAEIIRRLLDGRERGPKRDAVLFNAAAALVVAGKSRTLTEGWDLAGQLLDGGQAKAKLDELRG